MSDNEALNALIAEQSRREAAVIERACELALQSGDSGVLLTRENGILYATVTDEVPYGTIHDRTWSVRG